MFHAVYLGQLESKTQIGLKRVKRGWCNDLFNAKIISTLNKLLVERGYSPFCGVEVIVSVSVKSSRKQGR